MPTVSVDRAEFFSRIGREYTTKEFDELLFQYGLELDGDTTQDADHPKGERHQLKIEVPANRYDLLCLEGIASALNLYLHPEKGAPKYTVQPAPAGQQRTLVIHPETAKIRPYASAAILRGVKFNALNYASFIDLQDKLHANLARRRTLVAIGTHDLAKISPGNLSYEALPPKDIKFVPLNKDKEYDAEQLMELYAADRQLSKFLHIIKDSPVYPVILSSSRDVCSMPPIINSDLTKITLDTTDIFIDVTATDETKLDIVTDIIASTFAEYCSQPFSVEQVKIEYLEGCKGGARTLLKPELAPRPFIARTSNINARTGLALSRDQVILLLRQMGHDANAPSPSSAFAPINLTDIKIEESDAIHVNVPPQRPDILHECDLVEDAAVAYGFDNLKKTFPPTATVGKPYPPNKLSDVVRRLCSEAGWIEVLPLTLCSHDENYAFLNRKDPGKEAVVLANPKTIEYQIVRTSLLPGILKTVRENRKHSLPIKIFEVNDIVIQDPTQERGARNIRKAAGVFCGRKAGFEIVHGLLDRLMLGLGIKNLESKSSTAETGYYIEQFEHDTYFPGRAAKIYYRPPPASEPKQKAGPLDTLKGALTSALPGSDRGRDIDIGSLGILHPHVLTSFELDYPASAVEFDIEPFL